MNRQILLACLPYLSLMFASFAVAWLLLRLVRARPDWRHLRNLASDQRGAVQSLSFVLTVPAFVMVMMFIVQLSQLTIAKVVVEYSALATARSAQVWVPADLSVVRGGGPNQLPCWDYRGELTGPDGWNYSVFQIPREGVKYHKIRLAAVQSLLPICPSRDTGATLTTDGELIARSMEMATYAYAPGMEANPKVADRLRNKLAYALANTQVDLEVRHKGDEPPLSTYRIAPYPHEYACGEIGWHDQLILTVTHEFALLPGPGRLLARRIVPAASTPGSTTGSTTGATDTVADRIRPRNGVYTYTMQATARLYNEGLKPRIRYTQRFPGPTLALRLGARAPLVNPEAQSDYVELDSPYRNHVMLGDGFFLAQSVDGAPTAARPQSVDACCDDPPSAPWLALEPDLDDLPSVLRRKSP